MTQIVILATCVGCGIVGTVYGLRRPKVTLAAALDSWERTIAPGAVPNRGSGPNALGSALVERVSRSRWSDHGWVRATRSDLDLTGTSPERFATRVLVVAAAGTLAPLIAWLVAVMADLAIPVLAAALLVLVAVPVGVSLLIASLVRQARERRRHVRMVTASFVDLVVLSLAGGVGIDGALYAASQVSADWAAQRMGRALLTARESGATPWAALEALGREIGVPELVELATTVELAGTEGARIRQSLTARSASLRRHEQAEAESAANAMTERLFLPGALLLLGFLLFIGYPAFTRILGGF
jgi:tight adherence protein C